MGGITVTISAAHKEPAGAAAKEAGEWAEWSVIKLVMLIKPL